jgi:hypothetical protein
MELKVSTTFDLPLAIDDGSPLKRERAGQRGILSCTQSQGS